MRRTAVNNINIARTQMAASNTSHRLSRCQVVLNKRLLSEIVLLIRIWVFEFCYIFSCWVSSQFELLNFVTFWVLSNWVEFCPNSRFFSFVTIQVDELFLQFRFLSFVTIWIVYFLFTILVIKFCPNVSFWFSFFFFSQIKLISFVTI